jgi:hypothetical protein
MYQIGIYLLIITMTYMIVTNPIESISIAYTLIIMPTPMSISIMNSLSPCTLILSLLTIWNVPSSPLPISSTSHITMTSILLFHSSPYPDTSSASLLSTSTPFRIPSSDSTSPSPISTCTAS